MVTKRPNYQLISLTERFLLYTAIFYTKITWHKQKLDIEKTPLINFILGIFISPFYFIFRGYKKARTKFSLISHHLRLASSISFKLNKIITIYSSHF